MKTSTQSIGVIYARFSSTRQKEESIEQQVEECTVFAKANNIKVIHVYADKAISGRTDKRGQFQRMMKDAEKKCFDTVIAYKSNRISRNMLQALTHEARLDALGIKTLYAKEEFGNSAAGRFALRTMMNINQFYSENLAEDVKRGMFDNASQCKVTNGKLPYGYKAGKDLQYEINQQQADVVVEIFERIAAGEMFVTISESLNARGIKTGYGNKWRSSSYDTIVHNERYKGIYIYGEIRKDGGIPRIISDELFDKVQEVLKTKNTKGKRRGVDSYLLTGKIYCGKCGDTMVGVSGTSNTGELHYYYVCRSRRRKKCDMKNERRDEIEKLVAKYTREYILRDDVIEWIADSAVALQKAASTGSEIDGLERTLEENKKISKNLMSAVEQGLMTTEIKERLMEIDLDNTMIQKAITAAKSASRPIDKNRIVFTLQQFRNGDIDSKKYQKTLIDTFVKNVRIYENQIQIDYYHTDGDGSTVYPIGDAGDGSEVRTDSEWYARQESNLWPSESESDALSS